MDPMMMGGPGGRGPGGRGGGPGGGPGGMTERLGSTRIISILPEGTKVKGPDLLLLSPMSDPSDLPEEGENLIVVALVNQVLHVRIFDVDGEMALDTDGTKLMKDHPLKVKAFVAALSGLWPPHNLTPGERRQVISAAMELAGQNPLKLGDVVCELDSADFRDELRLQQIRYAQAAAWVDQAKSLLEVSQIAFEEYRQGIYPQDIQLVRQYVLLCRTEAERATRNYVWSKETTAKGYRSHAQMKADELSMQQAQIALHEAEGMTVRLETFTGPKLLKSLEAKIAAIRADKLSQDQSFEVEKDRLLKLQRMVDYCTLRAPGDGLVVYANVPDRMGRIDNPIQEGATVRQGQPVFYLPDPNQMQVKAKVNESKVAYIHSGQPVSIVVDAFPDRRLDGTVQDVTPIPAPATAAADVRVYYAIVSIPAGGFESLRPGLSAEVTFLIDDKRKVTRVPVQAVRWINAKSYVAVAAGRTQDPKSTQKEPAWHWQEVVLGISNPRYFEVISGLHPGEKVMARPEILPPPRTVTQRPSGAATETRAAG
jgi:multidrug resistance efflux pump